MKTFNTLLYLFFSVHLFAQEASVAYKTISYSYNYNKNIKLKMNCEMAEIVIAKCTGKTIEIKCTYSAKHADKNLAVKELERHQILVSKILNDVYISNYFTLLKGEIEPQAKLKIKMEIMVPNDIKIDIKNNFGSCSIKGLPLKGTLNQSFGKVDLQQINADLMLKCELSDITLMQYDGSAEILNKSGDVNIKNYTGKMLFIENSNANIDLESISNSVNIKLNLTNCRLHCKQIDYQKHALNIDSYKENINTNQKIKIEKKGDNYKAITTVPFPSFTIKSLYTKINLY